MLGELIPAQTFAFMLVFARVGGMVMLMPGFGEMAVSPWIRLGLAVAISAVIYPLVGATLPVMPPVAVGLAFAVGTEAMTGVFIGGMARLLLSALHVGGTVIAFQTGLAAAQGFDPAQQSQSAIVATFLTLIGVNLIFATNMHHLLIRAMVDSYSIFTPGNLPPVAQFSELAIATTAKSFAMGIQLASPFLVFGLIFNVGLGLIARLMPQLQVFFIAAPAQIMLGFTILAAVLSSTMMWFLDHFEAGMSPFLNAP
jgi:flagellar biosynthetic protein FliR